MRFRGAKRAALGGIKVLRISSILETGQTNGNAIITWTTNLSSTNNVVEYGTTTGYGSTTAAQGASTSHSRTLSGLTQDTVYHYRVKSTANGIQKVSADQTFTAPAAEVTQFTMVQADDIPSAGLFYPKLNFICPAASAMTRAQFDTYDVTVGDGSSYTTGQSFSFRDSVPTVTVGISVDIGGAPGDIVVEILSTDNAATVGAAMATALISYGYADAHVINGTDVIWTSLTKSAMHVMNQNDYPLAIGNVGTGRDAPCMLSNYEPFNGSFWFNIDGDGGDATAPWSMLPGGFEVDISSTDTAAQVAAALASAFSGGYTIESQVGNSVILRINNDNSGNYQDFGTNVQSIQMSRSNACPYIDSYDPIFGQLIYFFQKDGFGSDPSVTDEAGSARPTAGVIINSGDTISQVCDAMVAGVTASFVGSGFAVVKSGNNVNVTNANIGAATDASAGTMPGAGIGITVLTQGHL